LASVRYDLATRFYPGTPRPAVNELDLEVGDGELLVLVGPSGSGKTTALRMLAGLEPLDAGRVWIGERDVTAVHPRDRDIAMVFQNYALYPQLDVAQNMGFALKQRGVPKAERVQRVREVARLLDLEPFLDRKPKNLSGGQRQRVANLDAKLRVQTRAELAELQARLAVTTVYVTHDQVEAMTMGHRVAVLRDGELQQCDIPSTLYRAPANLFVAGFIGSPAMNQLPVEATTPLRIAGAEVHVGERLDGVVGDRLVIGFRPEALRVGDGPIAGRIRAVEDLGSEVFVHVLVEHDLEAATLVAKTSTPFAGHIGDNVSLSLNGTMHAFEPGGARLSTVAASTDSADIWPRASGRSA
jgi:multiple sugar transport system ATP-binding protein